jgi:CRP-like cAMP-binding protein
MSTETATGTTLFRHEPDAMVVSAGTVIFSVGDAPDGMYVVQEGEVDLVISGVNVETVGPTGVFGEMGLVDGLPRSATATTRTDTKLVCVDELRLMRMIEGNPFFALSVMRVIAARMRRTDEMLLGSNNS